MLALFVGLVIGVNWAGGRSPLQPTVPATSRPITAMHFSSPDAGWVLSLGELLATRDGGAHWRDITPGPRDPPIGPGRPSSSASRRSPRTKRRSLRRLSARA